MVGDIGRVNHHPFDRAAGVAEGLVDEIEVGRFVADPVAIAVDRRRNLGAEPPLASRVRFVQERHEIRPAGRQGDVQRKTDERKAARRLAKLIVDEIEHMIGTVHDGDHRGRGVQQPVEALALPLRALACELLSKQFAGLLLREDPIRDVLRGSAEPHRAAVAAGDDLSRP